MPAIENDIALLERLKKEGSPAFTEFDTIYRNWLKVVAITILRDQTQSEEIVQEFLIDFWANKRYNNIQIHSVSSLKNFLFISVRNRCLDYIARDNTRKKRLRSILLPEDHILPENTLENAELGSIIKQAISQLPPKQEEAFKLAYLHGNSRKEIAAIMHIAEDTVKKQVASAVKKLRGFLKDQKSHTPFL